MKLTKISTIIMMVLVVGLVGAFESHHAEALSLFGKTTYKVMFTAQNGVYVIPSTQDGVPGIRGCVLIASGDHIPGPTDLRVNGGYYTTLNPEPSKREHDRKNKRMKIGKETYEFFVPMDQLRTNGLPNTVEAWSTTYRVWSKDHTKTGKWEKKLGAAATATFVLKKVAVHDRTEEEAIALANANTQLGRTDASTPVIDSSDADTLASFFGNSADVPASTTNTSNQDPARNDAVELNGQAGETQPKIVAQPATKESSDLVLQFKVNQYQIIRLIGSDGQQIGPDHKGNANNDNGGAIIIRRGQLPLGGRVDVVTKATGDNQLMVYPVPTPYSFSGRVVNLR